MRETVREIETHTQRGGDMERYRERDIESDRERHR